MILNTESFELRILKKKRRLGIEQFKKGIKRILHFVVPAQEAKSGQPLAPILGQVQINTFDFASQFNLKSKDFPKGSLIYVELVVMWDKSYSINFKPFPIQCFIHEFVFTVPGRFGKKGDPSLLIFIGDIYKLILLYQKITGVSDLFYCLDTVLGSLNSFNIQITLFSEEEHINFLHYFLTNYWFYYLLIEKNVKGFGIYNNNLFYSYNLLQHNLVLVEDRELEENTRDGSEAETEILEY